MNQNFTWGKLILEFNLGAIADAVVNKKAFVLTLHDMSAKISFHLVDDKRSFHQCVMVKVHAAQHTGDFFKESDLFQLELQFKSECQERCLTFDKFLPLDNDEETSDSSETNLQAQSKTILLDTREKYRVIVIATNGKAAGTEREIKCFDKNTNRQIFATMLQRPQETFTDVEITSDKEPKSKFYAHRCVLASRSKMFDTMLHGSLLEGKSGKIVINNASAWVVETFLRHIYLKTYPKFLCKEHVIEMLGVADLYEFFKLKEYCLQKMLEMLNAKNGHSFLVAALSVEQSESVKKFVRNCSVSLLEQASQEPERCQSAILRFAKKLAENPE